MKIRVDTQKPFQGIIHGPNRTEPGCSVLGKSGLKTYLNIDLTAPSGSENNLTFKSANVSHLTKRTLPYFWWTIEVAQSKGSFPISRMTNPPELPRLPFIPCSVSLIQIEPISNAKSPFAKTDVRKSIVRT